MEGIPTDETSGRHLIEGRGIPIDGGIFRRAGQPGIVIDAQKLVEKKYAWFQEDSSFILEVNKNILEASVSLAEERMPLTSSGIQDFAKLVGEHNRYSLNYFVEKRMGVPDVQALYTALLIEIRLANDKEGRKVWIDKDKGDGHAIAKYEGKSGLYCFDPTKGDQKFVKLEETGPSNN